LKEAEVKYIGIDLHSTKSVVAVIDREDAKYSQTTNTTLRLWLALKSLLGHARY